jgi:hypothetical protein
LWKIAFGLCEFAVCSRGDDGNAVLGRPEMPTRESQLRRFAHQIAQQLPENKEDAILVLEYAKELVLWQSGERLGPIKIVG